MYRVALQRMEVPLPGGPGMVWVVTKCWNVHDEWATRAVDIDRRTPKRKKLRLLTPVPYLDGWVENPRAILEGYLVHERMKIEERS